MRSAPDGVLPISICYISAHTRCSGRIKSDRFMRSTGSGYRLELRGICLAIPSTLHDSLMARLDRLATVKEVAQLGATLGRTFTYELLQAVTPLDDAALQQALAQLVAAEFLYQRGVPPQATYFFKHALIQ